MLRRFRTLAPFLAILLLAAAPPADAGDRVNENADGVAVKGYDVVAYFTEGKPTPGEAGIEREWRGARWRFSSESNRALFQSDPDRYAPRYGGFCAGAMASGEIATVDPEAFAIIDGRLYLAFSQKGIAQFDENAETRVPRADANWDRLGEAK